MAFLLQNIYLFLVDRGPYEGFMVTFSKITLFNPNSHGVVHIRPTQFERQTTVRLYDAQLRFAHGMGMIQ